MGGNVKGSRRRFGAVRQLPSGRWQARYPGRDGLPRNAPETFARKTDADRWLSQCETEMAREEWIDPLASRILFSTYAQRWIAERPGLRTRTVELYSALLRLHLAPTFGDHAVADLTPPRVRAWRKERLDSGVGPVTVAKAYRLLRSITGTAVEDGLMRQSPCRIRGGGLEDSPERPIASIAELYAVAHEIQPRYRALVLLAMFGSLRWGELMALRREHIDLVGITVRVEAAVVETGRGLELGPPKTAAGRRTVAIPEAIVPDLQWHLQRFAEAGPDGRVFVGPKGATPHRNNFNVIWRKAVTDAGITSGLRFHDLRHTGNTLAASTGASLRELMSRMGHASTRAALIYQHATSDRDRAIADAMNRLAKAAQPDREQSVDALASGTDLARDA
jgi:integrase